MKLPRLYIKRKGDLTEQNGASGVIVYCAVIDIERIATVFPLGTNLPRAHELDFELRRRLRNGDDVTELMAWLAVAAMQPPKKPITCALVPQLADAYLSCKVARANKRQVFLCFLRLVETVECGMVVKHCMGGKMVTTADYPALANVTVDVLLDDICKKYRDIRLQGLKEGTPTYNRARRSVVVTIEQARTIFVDKALEHYGELKEFTLPNVAAFLTEDIGSKLAPTKKLAVQRLVPLAHDLVRNAPNENLFRAGVLLLFCGLSKAQLMSCHTDQIKSEDSGYILLVGKKRLQLEASLARRLLTVPGFVLSGTGAQRRKVVERASVHYATNLQVKRGLSVLRKLYCCLQATITDPVTAAYRIGWTSTLAKPLLDALPRLSRSECDLWQASFPPEPLPS